MRPVVPPMPVRVSSRRAGVSGRKKPIQFVGTTGFEAADVAFAMPFDAVTVKVYEVPLLKPPPTALVGQAPTLADRFPGGAATVLPWILVPPLKSGGVQFTTAETF